MANWKRTAQPEAPVLLTASEVAELLGLPRLKVRKKTVRGELPCIKTKAGNLYRPSDLRLLIEGRARTQKAAREWILQMIPDRGGGMGGRS